MDQHEKAQAFRRMHVEPPILVLPNAWDVASAKALAAIGGCRALATSSAAVARSLGFEDGERAPGAVMVEAAGRIAQAVDVPVTGDLERGYNDPVGTARAAWEAGLVAVDEQVSAIRAIREAVPELVINARVDTFVHIGSGDVAEAAERGNAYLAAGADCVYPILAPVNSIDALVHRIKGPINVIAAPATPPPAELDELGVARMTWGSNLATAAYAEAVRIAASAFA